MTSIYKILPADDWRQALAKGWFDGSPLDLADGYIHLSTAEQAQETARKHFHGQDGLVLARFDAEALGGAIRWEPSRGGQLFPHHYGPLDVGHALDVRDLVLGADGAPVVVLP